MVAVSLLAGPIDAQSPQTTAPLQAFPAFEIQVLLDRAGFSPGEIDGKRGSNTERALAAYARVHPQPTGTSDDAILRGGARGADATPLLVSYTITPEDAAGPFRPIPDDMMEKAKLPALGYSSLAEMLGERFHVSPTLLAALNPGVSLQAGATIQVPNVETAPPASPPAAAKVVVSRSMSSMTALDAQENVLFYAPTTTGSEHDPLPIGTWAVTAVLHNPVFNYNPDLFWDANPSQMKARLPAGPNGPVGTIWIDLTKEHYGLHGSPEPSQIGHTSSHGCVRLTNWDAAKLAAMVKKGTPVIFVE